MVFAQVQIFIHTPVKHELRRLAPLWSDVRSYSWPAADIMSHDVMLKPAIQSRALYPSRKVWKQFLPLVTPIIDINAQSPV